MFFFRMCLADHNNFDNSSNVEILFEIYRTSSTDNIMTINSYEGWDITVGALTWVSQSAVGALTWVSQSAVSGCTVSCTFYYYSHIRNAIRNQGEMITTCLYLHSQAQQEGKTYHNILITYASIHCYIRDRIHPLLSQLLITNNI